MAGKLEMAHQSVRRQHCDSPREPYNKLINVGLDFCADISNVRRDLGATIFTCSTGSEASDFLSLRDKLVSPIAHCR